MAPPCLLRRIWCTRLVESWPNLPFLLYLLPAQMCAHNTHTPNVPESPFSLCWNALCSPSFPAKILMTFSLLLLEFILKKSSKMSRLKSCASVSLQPHLLSSCTPLPTASCKNYLQFSLSSCLCTWSRSAWWLLAGWYFPLLSFRLTVFYL